VQKTDCRKPEVGDFSGHPKLWGTLTPPLLGKEMAVSEWGIFVGDICRNFAKIAIRHFAKFQVDTVKRGSPSLMSKKKMDSLYADVKSSSPDSV